MNQNKYLTELVPYFEITYKRKNPILDCQLIKA